MASSLNSRSLLDISDLKLDEIISLFEKTKKLKADPKSYGQGSGQTRNVAMMFFEPSTRTKSSFEMAAFRLGLRVLSLSATDSSVKKGETVYDTAKNIEALNPDLMIIRHSGSGIPYQISKQVRVPIINAGDGFHAHPTQALLDAYTIWEKFGIIKGLNILIVGDIAHSRVARSNIKCLKLFGAKMRVCGPPTLLPPHLGEWGVEYHWDLDQALVGADVVMALRMQLERQSSFQVPSIKEFSQRYGLTTERLAQIQKNALIMHPGPVNRGVEMTSSALKDPRSCVIEQVQNGAYLRQVLMGEILGLSPQNLKEPSR